jgi:AsmA-like C-terminal region
MVQSAGRGRFSLDQGAQITATLEVATADLRPLRPSGATDRTEALPFSMASRLAIAGRAVAFDDIDAKVGQSAIRGHLSIDGVSPRRIDGALETDALDAAALVARAIGMPAQAKRDGAAWSWSSEPFGSGVLGDFAGRIALKARRVELLPHLDAREFRATLRLGKDELAFDDMAAAMAGGKFAGRMSFGAAEDGLTARIKISLAGADTAGLLSSGARPAVTGMLALSAEMKGNGLSPVALIGSLQGAGKFTLSGAQFAGLDPRAFDAVTQAVDRGLAIDAERISNVVNKALDSGQLSVERVEGTVALSAGQVRLSNVSADGKGAKLSLAGNVDLIDGSIDARLLLSGASQETATRPDVFMALKGPLTAPVRNIDVSALTGWLTLRAIDNQAKHLRAIEETAPRPQPKTPAPKTEQAPPLPAPVVITPMPVPRRAPSGASIGPQN